MNWKTQLSETKEKKQDKRKIGLHVSGKFEKHENRTRSIHKPLIKVSEDKKITKYRTGNKK